MNPQAFVYVGQDKNKTRFKIGLTKDTATREKSHRTSNPDFKYYRRYETDRPRQAERFLKMHLADYLVPGTTEWFATTSRKIDEALLALDRYMFLLPSTEQLHQLSLFTSQKSNDQLLQANDAARDTHHKLRINFNEMKRLKLEAELHTNNLKLLIGPNRGMDGIATWETCSMGLHVDEQLLKTKYPEAYTACRVPRTTRKFRLLASRKEKIEFKSPQPQLTKPRR